MESSRPAMPQAVFFDLDGTLARSKQPIDSAMAALLAQLLARTKVGVTSGGKLEQLAKQVADQLPADTVKERLYLLPTSGAALFSWSGDTWQNVYEESLTDAELEHVKERVLFGAQASGIIDFNAPSSGERVELRGSQVTLSALGQEAPMKDKQEWDPTHEKRHALRAAIAPLLPDYDVKVGGATSVDITKKGVNKAYGIRQFSERYDIPIDEMLYVGDELSSGGNDEVVKETGIRTHAVANPDETAAFVAALLS